MRNVERFLYVNTIAADNLNKIVANKLLSSAITQLRHCPRLAGARGLELREIAGILQLFFRVQRTKSTEQWVKTFGSQPGESSCSFQLFDTVIYWIFIRIC